LVLWYHRYVPNFDPADAKGRSHRSRQKLNCKQKTDNPQEYLLASRPFRNALLYLSLSFSIATAQTLSPATAVSAAPTPNWLDILRDLPVVRWAMPSSAPAAPTAPLAPPVCKVAPLPAIQDLDAQEFENATGLNGAIDTTGLKPPMARALDRFRQLVTSLGGTFDLKSAYRPEAYQEHLQQVWFKWMEMRNNHDSGCQMLRAAVEEEFTRHHLIETQKPVTSSDHTRGLAFDAVVVLPKNVHMKRRRVTLDKLSLLAGLKRPDIVHDPVHFKLVLRGTKHA